MVKALINAEIEFKYFVQFIIWFEEDNFNDEQLETKAKFLVNLKAEGLNCQSLDVVV